MHTLRFACIGHFWVGGPQVLRSAVLNNKATFATGLGWDEF